MSDERMSESSLPAPGLPTRRPHRALDTAEFWDGCARGELVLPRCDACHELIWYPRRVCPFCSGMSVTWERVTGLASVYSYTVMWRGNGPWRAAVPYVMAYVELDEGPRLLTNIVGADPATVHIGQRVQVVFEPADDGDGDALYRFTPIA